MERVHVANLGEEVVRDSPVFVASLLAAELEPRLRRAVGASAWQVSSGGQGAWGLGGGGGPGVLCQWLTIQDKRLDEA
jgi:hypothetical protein